MITRLNIRNYAIIEQVTIDFSKNLTIITGETGAGKSILLGALHLIMGGRADTKVLYDTTQKCVVEAVFSIGSYHLQPFFEENELDYEDELVIHREITPAGKTRAFVNDTPVSLAILKELSAALIDLHQQFDTLDIHHQAFQLRMIDALAGNKQLLSQYENDYKSYQSMVRKRNELVERNRAGAKEMDFLLFQLKELTEADLQLNEQENLESELRTLNNAETIKRNLSAAYDLLIENEQALTGGLRSVAQLVTPIRDFHKTLPAIYERIESSIYELQDIAEELNTIAEDTEHDPERIQEVNDRLSVLYRLQQKHQVAEIADLIALRNELEDKVGGFADLGGEIDRLNQAIVQQEQALRAKANTLTERRAAVVAPFEEKVHTMLRPLSMPYAVFKVDMTQTADLGVTGMDKVNFLFAANKGSRLETIKEVASGGEISRLTLVTKSLVASAIPLPTLIFDEIDTGVSGDVALKMGGILHELARHHQVVSITHTPQVAARADAHYFVHKNHRDDRTVTNVKQLSETERITEIATMLSGSPPSKAALENAASLLGA